MGSRHYRAPAISPTRASGKPTLCFAACVALCAAAAPALPQHPLLFADLPEAPQPQSSSPSAAPQPNSIRGTVLDRDGAMLSNAHVTLSETSPVTFVLETTSAADGTFTLSGVPAGPFTLTVAAPGFATEQTSATMIAGASAQLSPITLHPGISSDVEVTLTRTEIAEDQIHAQEEQHVLGFIPNFYVSYVPHPLPLSPRQKGELALKTTIDPFTFLIAAGIAGIEQGTNSLSGYGPGIGGYGKRFGAIYTTGAVNTAIGGAILPILLHQDPRYFYVGTGSARHRALHSVMQVFVSKGDNGRWQPDYSGIGGAVASAGIANAYLPSTDRDDAGTIVLNTLNSFWGAAIGNLCQEFLVRHFTPHLPPTQLADPASTASPSSPKSPQVTTSPSPANN